MASVDSPATSLDLPTLALPRATAALARPGGLRVTVFDASATAEDGASWPEASYPAVMQAALRQRHAQVTLGSPHASLDGVVEDAPDLLLLEVGGGEPLQPSPLEGFEQRIRDAVARLRVATAADIVLIDQPFCRALEDCAAFPPFLTSLHRIGQELGIAVFPRYRLMQGWCDMPGMTRERLSPDGLHMGDEGHALLGRALSGWLLPGLVASS